MRSVRVFICAVLLSFLISADLPAQGWQDTVTLIEKAFDRYKSDIPGAQLAVSRNGQLLFSKAWGMADLEHNIPLTNESVIEAGSVSKQFTAACILLLEQEGKLSLDDDVRKYVPELPDYGYTITLRNMMQHVSGLKDWGSVAGVSGWPRSTKTYDNDDALYIISKQKTLNHKPGDEYIYSNSNYNLFAIIIERVSGKSLADYSKEKIFIPAGMSGTEWRNNFKRVVPQRAIAYSKEGNVYETDMPNEYVYGNGGLLTTVEDLVKWNNYYLNGRLGSPSLLARQTATNPLNGGAKGYYGAGLRIDSVRGWKIISHNGATASYRANLEYFPDAGITIALLSNSSEFDGKPSPVEDIRRIFMADKSLKSAAGNTKQFVASEKSLQKFTGWYREPKSGSGMRLQIRDGKLADDRGGYLEPVAENKFRFRVWNVEMLTVEPRQVKMTNGEDMLLWVATDSAFIDTQMLQQYAGKYYSSETESGFSVSVKNGKVIVHRDPKTDYTLLPIYRDGFLFPGGTLVFLRDNSGKVDRMQVNVGRARNLVFEVVGR